MALRLAAAAVSTRGPRPTNQDSAFAGTWGAGVADGVGGGPAGDLASAVFLHRLVAGWQQAPDGRALIERALQANWDLAAHTERDPSLAGMATTFTGIFLTGAGAVLTAHIGDSRAYLLRDDRMVRMTRDDSLVQALVDGGHVREEDAASHPYRHLITASLSGGSGELPFIADEVAHPGDRWLLCSDGLTDHVCDDDIAEALGEADRRVAASELVSRALRAGTGDNVTAVVCDVVAGADAGNPLSPRFVGAAARRFREESAPGPDRGAAA